MAVALEELNGYVGGRACPGGRPSRPRLRVVGPDDGRYGRSGQGSTSSAARTRPARPPSAVYRRRRVAVGLLAAVSVGVMMAVVSLAGAHSTAVAEAPSTVQRSVTPAVPMVEAAIRPTTVVIAPGETVWTRVGGLAPDGMDRREWVARVLELNDVDPLAVAPGTTLQLPSGD